MWWEGVYILYFASVLKKTKKKLNWNRVIEVVPLFYTTPRALLCTIYKSVYDGAIFIATNIMLHSASSTSWFSLIMEISEETWK